MKLSDIEQSQILETASELFADPSRPIISIGKEILVKGTKYLLKYSTEIYPEYYSTLRITNQAASMNVNRDYGLDLHEVGERTFTMSQVSADYWKITSGLFIRPDHEGRGLGTILVGLTNKVIQDMIARHLRNEPNTRVYAFLEDGSTASNQHLDYSGWTSFHAKKLGFYPLKNKQYDPLFMKRFPVKQILANSVNAQPTLSTPHPHHQV